jgi:Glu-tRNA(Gln) amidotransferase subunit E-like FAD-binding protein
MKLKKTLSSFAYSIEKGAEATFKKSEELYNITKLKMEISSQEELIQDMYAEIGEKIFKKHIHGRFSDRDLEDYFKTIRKARREIDELNKRINNIKKRKLCKICSAEMLSKDKYCPKCGLKQ